MPGLFGAFSLRTHRPLPIETRERVLREMAARLAHSGRESVATWASADGRLAIARSDQPWPRAPDWPAAPVADQPRRVLFLDGRLHPQSAAAQAGLGARTDETAARLAALRGFWSAAVYDAGAGLALAVDRHASRPVCYAIVDDVLYFAPEVKAVLAAPGLSRAVDPAACGLMLASGYLLSSQTLFTAVRRLAGGEMLVAEAAKENGESRTDSNARPAAVRVQAYWRYRMTVDGDGTSAATLEAEMAELLKAAVARNFDAPERSCVLLSGGTDSRAILGGALAAVGGDGRRLHTVTWSDAVARRHSDFTVARELARRFSLHHRELPRRIDDYARRFTRLNYIGDAHSDMAAYHPYEMELVETMAHEGLPCVLRGDECFGWASTAPSVTDALHELGLRRLSGVTRCVAALRPAAREAWSTAADAAITKLEVDYRDAHPDVAKDELYFRQRLQGYLNSIAYPKHVVADHRNPLLDEALLDFNQRVSAPARLNKGLFRRAAARAFPEAWAAPFSRTPNLVDWLGELTRDSPVRRYMQAEIADESSAAWEVLDRGAVRATFDSLPRGETRPPLAVRMRARARKLAREAVRLVPAVERRLRRSYHRVALPAEFFLFRVMVLKHAFDVFVSGGGGRAAYEAHAARVADGVSAG
ncbi:MAG: asparagine synthase-related protein [Phycisphaerae bacterium]